jgi:hypothetical protein
LLGQHSSSSSSSTSRGGSAFSSSSSRRRRRHPHRSKGAATRLWPRSGPNPRRNRRLRWKTRKRTSTNEDCYNNKKNNRQQLMHAVLIERGYKRGVGHSSRLESTRNVERGRRFFGKGVLLVQKYTHARMRMQHARWVAS